MNNILDKIYTAFMQRKYPDWEDNEYNCGDLKFIWGVKSPDDITSTSANIYTMNDIDVMYSRKSGLYMLSIETAYMFDDGKRGEVAYLCDLLDKFTEFMNKHNYSTNVNYALWMDVPHINMNAESIPELYTQFRIFVEGYKAVYGGEENA